jgi:hypothetical protein
VQEPDLSLPDAVVPLRDWFERILRDPAQQDQDSLHAAVWAYTCERNRLRSRIYDLDDVRKQTTKERYDLHICDEEFVPGQVVMLWDTTVGKTVGNKLHPHWRGPFKVTGYAGDHKKTYIVAQVNGKRIRGTFHGNHYGVQAMRRLSNPTKRGTNP